MSSRKRPCRTPSEPCPKAPHRPGILVIRFYHTQVCEYLYIHMSWIRAERIRLNRLDKWGRKSKAARRCPPSLPVVGLYPRARARSN